MNHLKLLVAGLCLAIASPAMAKQCPSGQILRVSKGVCIARAAAEKAGIRIGNHRRVAHAVRAAKEVPSRKEPTDQMEARAQEPADRSGTTEVPRQSDGKTALGFAALPTQSFVASQAASPFGGLSFDGLTR